MKTTIFAKKSLVIVESPGKAKTINRYLGPDFDVQASMGHVRDLPSKGLNVDIEYEIKSYQETQNLILRWRYQKAEDMSLLS